MKRKIISMLLVVLIIFTMYMGEAPVMVKADSSDRAMKVKECLIQLDIYKEFSSLEKTDIDQQVTLIQAIVMVVRLMGAEKIALSGVYSGEHPYTDIPKWADDYIGYAYTVSLIESVKENKLNGEKKVTAKQFLDILLRGALEYTEIKDSIAIAKKIGLINSDVNTSKFTLKDALLLCYNSLEMKVKDNYDNYTLTQRNINDFKVYTLNNYQKQRDATDKFIVQNKKKQKQKEDKAKGRIPQKDISIVKSYKPYYVSSGTKEKTVYLTFDDGPNEVITPIVLDVLKKYNVKATFFMVGSYVDKYPKMTKRVYDEGHTIANHTYTHDYGYVYSSTENFTKEVQKTEKSINKALGFNYNNNLFRFPGGSHNRNNKFKDEIYKLGYQYYDWNAAGEDAMPGPAPTAYNVLSSTIRTSKDGTELTVLYHDAATKRTTAQALPQIIQYFKENGYVFKTLDNVPRDKTRK